MDVADHEVYRHNGNGDREHETKRKKIKGQLLPSELHPRKYEGRQAAGDQHTSRCRHHNDEAVAHQYPE